MLVLSRKKEQRIVIGSDIQIVVIESRGGVVKLGIEAPPDVSVHREEVYRRIERERHESAPDELLLSLAR